MGPVLRCPGAGARLRFGIRHSPRVFKVEVHAVKRCAVTWLAAAPSGAGRLAVVRVRALPGASAVRYLSSFKVNPRRAARSDALACASLVCDSSNRLVCMGRCWNRPPPESLARGVASCRLTFCSSEPPRQRPSPPCSSFSAARAFAVPGRSTRTSGRTQLDLHLHHRKNALFSSSSRGRRNSRTIRLRICSIRKQRHGN